MVRGIYKPLQYNTTLFHYASYTTKVRFQMGREVQSKYVEK